MLCAASEKICRMDKEQCLIMKGHALQLDISTDSLQQDIACLAMMAVY